MYATLSSFNTASGEMVHRRGHKHAYNPHNILYLYK